MNKSFIIFVILAILVVSYFIFIMKQKEEFSLPNFIQFLPEYGNAPLTVSFVPIYINEGMKFMIDFGDNSKHISNSLIDNYGIEHTYKTAGTYNGCVTFQTEKNETIKKQPFVIYVL